MKNQLILFTIFLMLFSTISCKQKLNDTVVDFDGNVYHTVKIGTQFWMAENLKVTHYQNGDAIPNVTDSTKWIKLKTGAYCNYNNDTNISRTYGRLYNWYALNDSRNIAPKGWHVPTNAEWTILIQYLGGDKKAGGKMKEKGTMHWKTPNIGATNESGLGVLPGGDRYYGLGSYDLLGEMARIWTKTEVSDTFALPCNMSYDINDICRFSTGKASGFSARLIKD